MSQIIPFNHMDKDGVFHSRTATTLHVLDKGLIEVEADDEVAFRNIESFFCDTCCKYTCGILASSDIYYQTNEQFTIPDLNSSMVLSCCFHVSVCPPIVLPLTPTRVPGR